MSYGVGLRRSSDLALLWLWLWLWRAATAPIRPLVWESPYAMGVALKRPKTKKKKDLQSAPLSFLFLFSNQVHLPIFCT